MVGESIMKIDILTLFPEMFDGVLSSSIIGRAKDAGLVNFEVTDIRDYSDNKHRKADDYPFGGGAGLLMMVQPIKSALDTLGFSNYRTGSEISDAEGKRPRFIYMSPRGRVLDKELAEDLASEDNLVLLCGHYEGIDQRALDLYNFEEVSIGDYVLTGGEIPAMVLLDTTCRLITGVLGSDDSHNEESVYSGLLEYPQYTRPASFEGIEVPAVLTSGNHRHIELWNFEQALELTAKRRPEMLKAFLDTNFDSLDKAKKKLAEKYL